jgi:hypothetical protein
MLFSSDSDDELLMIMTILAMQQRPRRQRGSTSRRRRSIQRRLEFNSSNKFNIDQIQCSNQDSKIKGKISCVHSVKHFRYIFLHPKLTWEFRVFSLSLTYSFTKYNDEIIPRINQTIKIFWKENSLLVSLISLPLHSLSAALTKSSCFLFLSTVLHDSLSISLDFPGFFFVCSSRYLWWRLCERERVWLVVFGSEQCNSIVSISHKTAFWALKLTFSCLFELFSVFQNNAPRRKTTQVQW